MQYSQSMSLLIQLNLFSEDTFLFFLCQWEAGASAETVVSLF